MFDFAFAYTGAMQIILFCVSCITTLFFYTFTTNIILLIYGEKVSFRRKAAYVFLAGTVLNNFWTYGIYYLGGLLDFSPVVYNIVTVPNPIFALFFFLLGVKILNLSPYRSVRLLSNAYVFIIVIKVFQRMVGFTFFMQTGNQYNYLIDTASLIVCTAIYSTIYLIIRTYIIRSHFSIRLVDSAQSRVLWKEILLLLLKSSAIYAFLVLYPMYANVDKDLYLLVMLGLLVFVFVVCLLNDQKISFLMECENKAAHVKILNDTIDDFSGLRHDISNILQTYGGYIAVGNLEKLKEYHNSLFDDAVLLNEMDVLNRKLEENPTLISLLMQKHRFAKQEHTNMRINITCDITNLYINEMDLCRTVGNLVDNAIEAAKEAPKKWVDLLIEEKPGARKLIIISNSTKGEVNISSAVRAGFSSKEGHMGLGLNHTRKILRKYPNCAFQTFYYDHEFTAYISIAAR